MKHSIDNITFSKKGIILRANKGKFLRNLDPFKNYCEGKSSIPNGSGIV